MKWIIATLALITLGQHNPSSPNGALGDRVYVIAPTPHCTDPELILWAIETSTSSVRMNDAGTHCLLKFYPNDLDHPGMPGKYNSIKGLSRASQAQIRNTIKVTNAADWDGEP